MGTQRKVYVCWLTRRSICPRPSFHGATVSRTSVEGTAGVAVAGTSHAYLINQHAGDKGTLVNELQLCSTHQYEVDTE